MAGIEHWPSHSTLLGLPEGPPLSAVTAAGIPEQNAPGSSSGSTPPAAGWGVAQTQSSGGGGRPGGNARGTSVIRTFPSEVPRPTTPGTGHCGPDSPLGRSLQRARGLGSKLFNQDPLESDEQLLQVTPGGTFPHRRPGRGFGEGRPVSLLPLLNLPEGDRSGPVDCPLTIQNVFKCLQGLGDGTWLAFQGDCGGGFLPTAPQKAIDREGGLSFI